jgi:hypothetical protein
MPTPNWAAQAHNKVQLRVCKYCVWCKELAEEWAPKKRSVLAELVNGERFASEFVNRKAQGFSIAAKYAYARLDLAERIS